VIKEPYEGSVAVVYEKNGMCEANRMYGYHLIFHVCYRNSSKKFRLSSYGIFSVCSVADSDISNLNFTAGVFRYIHMVL